MPLGAVTEIDAVDLIAALRTIAHIQRVQFSADCQPDQIYDRDKLNHNRWAKGPSKRMCGIVGILGAKPVAGQLVDALKRLEYRGYDSAGVATLERGILGRRRAEGKLRALETRLEREPLGGTIGIGHTRWATHGRPSEVMRTRMPRTRSRWFTMA